MVKRLTLSAILMLLSVSLVRADEAEGTDSLYIEWAESFADAQALGMSENRVILLDFYNDRCVWCKRLDSVTFVDPAVAAISKSIVFSKFDADKDTILAKIYGVAGYPTMVLIKPNGTELDRLVGFYPPEEFVPALFDIMQNRNTLDDYLTRLTNHPDSHALRIEVAEKYQYRSMNVPATMHYDYIILDDPENLQGFSDNSMLALGRMKLKAERYSDAIDMFEKLQDRYPDSELFEEANVYVPYTYMKAGEDKKAIEYFEVFKTEFPESEDIEWVDKSIAEIKEGKK